MNSTRHMHMKVVVARSREGNEELSDMLERAGVTPIQVDTIEIRPAEDIGEVDSVLRRIDSYDWVGFTSSSGVRVFAERMGLLGLKLRPGRPKIAAVGARTARALRESGFREEFVPSRYLTSELGRQLPSESGSDVLLLRADIAEKALVETLTERGFRVTDVPVYRTVKIVGMLPDDGSLDDADVVAFASPSEVRGFEGRVAEATLERLRRRATAACIGPVTAEAATEAGFEKVAVSGVHTAEALVKTVLGLSGID